MQQLANSALWPKAHTTVPLVLHPTMMDKYVTKNSLSMANGGIKTFFYSHQWFFLVKEAMNAPSICKLDKNCITGIDQYAMVLKRPQFLRLSL
jgi:hypothetical protein